MAIRNIVKEGDEVLRKKSREVVRITDRERALIGDMIETLGHANGCGLAAPQVGILKRIVIIDTEETGLVVMINPEIISAEGTQEDVEGCLSIPNQWGVTKRPRKVSAKALDINGKEFTVSGEGLAARAICHEIDHLDGTLFIDKVIRMLDSGEIE